MIGIVLRVGRKVLRPNAQDIISPPPPPPVAKRRTSSNVVKGVLVKRKSESQGGESKRRRSSVTESPRIEKNPSVRNQCPTPVESSSTLTTSAAPVTVLSNPPPKNGMTKGGLAGFEHYSDSDDDSE